MTTRAEGFLSHCDRKIPFHLTANPERVGELNTAYADKGRKYRAFIIAREENGTEGAEGQLLVSVWDQTGGEERVFSHRQVVNASKGACNSEPLSANSHIFQLSGTLEVDATDTK